MDNPHDLVIKIVGVSGQEDPLLAVVRKAIVDTLQNRCIMIEWVQLQWQFGYIELLAADGITWMRALDIVLPKGIGRLRGNLEEELTVALPEGLGLSVSVAQ